MRPAVVLLGVLLYALQGAEAASSKTKLIPEKLEAAIGQKGYVVSSVSFTEHFQFLDC